MPPHHERDFTAWARRFEDLGLTVRQAAYFAPTGWLVHTPPVDHGELRLIEHTVFVYPDDEGWTMRLTVHGGPHWLSHATDADLEQRVLDALRADLENPGPEWRTDEDDDIDQA